MRLNWRRQHLSEWWTFSCWWRDFYVYCHSEITLPVCHSRWGHFQGKKKESVLEFVGIVSTHLMTSKKGVICGFWWETNLFRQIRFGWVHHGWWAIALLRMLLLYTLLFSCLHFTLVLRCWKDVTLPPLDVKVVRKGHGLVTKKKKQTQMKWKISFHGKKNERNTSSPKKNCKKGGHFHFFSFFFSTSAVMCCNYSIIGTRYATLLCERVLFRILVPHTYSAQGTVSAVDDERSTTSFVSFTSPNEVNSILTCATSASQRKVKKHLTLLILIRSHHLKMLRITVPHIQPLLR